MPKNSPTFSDLFRRGLCTNHTGKMSGMISFSTNCKSNPWCRAKAARGPECICAHCYAQTQLSYQPATRAKSQRNTDLITARRYHADEFPFINAAFFRLEAFGDLVNVDHLFNYVQLCIRNPQTIFSLYTKNYFLVRLLFDVEHVEKPKNLLVVYGSPFINSPVSPDLVPLADKVFTVYSKEFAQAHKIDINCGGRRCIDCKRCYSKRTKKEVSELLK